MWKKAAYHINLLASSTERKHGVYVSQMTHDYHTETPDSCSKHIATTSSTQRKHMYHNMQLLS
jgi:hypothetical protein